MPQLMADYVNTGKVQYVFVDYPIAQLHPDASLSHEAAACAGDQGKYWQMHDSCLRIRRRERSSQLTAQARHARSRYATKFDDVHEQGRAASTQRRSAQSVARMQQLGVGGTPLVAHRPDPPPGSPMKVVSFVYGAQPYPEFKTALDAALADAIAAQRLNVP